MFPEDPLDNANPFNNLAVMLVGADLATSVPVVLPADAWARTAETRIYTCDYMIGANGHAAAPAVYQFPVAGAAVAEASEIQARPALVLPPATASTFLVEATGRYTLQGFYARFIAAGMADPDAAVVARTTIIRDWWRFACTHPAGHIVSCASRLLPLAPLCTRWP